MLALNKHIRNHHAVQGGKHVIEQLLASLHVGQHLQQQEERHFGVSQKSVLSDGVCRGEQTWNRKAIQTLTDTKERRDRKRFACLLEAHDTRRKSFSPRRLNAHRIILTTRLIVCLNYNPPCLSQAGRKPSRLRQKRCARRVAKCFTPETTLGLMLRANVLKVDGSLLFRNLKRRRSVAVVEKGRWKTMKPQPRKEGRGRGNQF